MRSDLSSRGQEVADWGLGGGVPLMLGVNCSLGVVVDTEGLDDDVQVEGGSLFAIVVNSEHSGLKNHDATDAH